MYILYKCTKKPKIPSRKRFNKRLLEKLLFIIFKQIPTRCMIHCTDFKILSKSVKNYTLSAYNPAHKSLRKPHNRQLVYILQLSRIRFENFYTKISSVADRAHITTGEEWVGYGKCIFFCRQVFVFCQFAVSIPLTIFFEHYLAIESFFFAF